ncbi:hypothetical protein [Nocardia terpenica]|uniref:HNH endonuclease n=1 Tax=Nocardia terpenica TaxID=455432 RepID=A0A161XC55_9NOCA|nr:hypothetical protein [Nocardia terpenica]KZM70768.1 hypothetical protein AWN90_40120 [Nocardia terpenica]NQE89966.1 hypothetical protein [Nocardia terpenica]
MPTRTARRTTTQRGLGWVHQQAVAALLRSLPDGSPCWWCGMPMYRDPARNFDQRQLQGDHSTARAVGGTVTDRLLHATCNGSRGDGSRDHLRPAITGQPVDAVSNRDDRGCWCLLEW